MSNAIILLNLGVFSAMIVPFYVLTFMRILVFSYCCQHLILCMYNAWCVHACHGLSVEVRGQPWVLGLLCTLFKAEPLLLYFLFCLLLYVRDYLTHELLGILFSLPCIALSCVMITALLSHHLAFTWLLRILIQFCMLVRQIFTTWAIHSVNIWHFLGSFVHNPHVVSIFIFFNNI